MSSHKKQRSLHLFLVRTGSKYRFRVGDNKPKGSLFCACGSAKPPKAAFFVRLFQRCLVESCGWGACCGQGMFGSVCGAPVHSVDVCEARNVSQIHGMGRIAWSSRRKLHKKLARATPWPLVAVLTATERVPNPARSIPETLQGCWRRGDCCLRGRLGSDGEGEA